MGSGTSYMNGEKQKSLSVYALRRTDNGRAA